MTKIPTVRERYEEKFGWAGSSGTFTGIRDEEIVKFITAEREAGARVAEIKSELQSDSFTGCILRILQDFASIQEPTNKHYLEAATRVSNAALFHANIDGGKVMFNTIEEALTPPTK